MEERKKKKIKNPAKYIQETIETKTNLIYEIGINTAENIKNIRDSLPNLSSFLDAMKIHKILFTSLGVIKNLNLPSDVFIRMLTTRIPGVS